MSSADHKIIAYRGILIPADISQPVRYCEPESFDEMKKLMGIDLAEVADTFYNDEFQATFWADEEALCIDEPVHNIGASALLGYYRAKYRNQALFETALFGPVFINGIPNEDGAQSAISDEALIQLRTILATAGIAIEGLPDYLNE